MKKKNNNPFKNMQNATIGMAGLGITTGLVAGIDSKLPAGTPSLTPAMNTMVSFAPVMTTAIGAKSVLDVLPKNKKNRW